MLTAFRSMLLVPAFVLGASGSVAQGSDGTGALFEALGLPEMIEIMREEGLDYGRDIGTDLLGEADDPQWAALVSEIYNADRMRSAVAEELAAELEGADTQPMLDFFKSELGETIIGLEVSARRALLDEAVEEASKEAAAIAMADETPRHAQVERFVAANELVETNVVGAMNSNYAFYIGMMDGGAFPQELTEDQILADVWSQEPEIRANTTEWVYSFLLMAYQPLSDDELEAYIAFSESEAGQALNSALFGAFDGLFEDISRQLGFASAQFMGQEEI